MMGWVGEGGELEWSMWRKQGPTGSWRSVELGYGGEPEELGRANIPPPDALPGRWWGNGIVGIAEATYPNPAGFVLEGTRITLDKLRIRDLTVALRERRARAPACEAKWEEVLGRELPWRDIWRSFGSSQVTTTVDNINAFKVCHRAVYSRRRLGAATTECRLCGREEESIRHLLNCEVIRNIMGEVVGCAGLAAGRPVVIDELLVGFGLEEREGRLSLLPGGLLGLQRCAWKLILGVFNSMDTEGVSFNEKYICCAAVRRVDERVRAYVTRVRNDIYMAMAADAKPRSAAKAAEAGAPFTTTESAGLADELRYTDVLGAYKYGAPLS